MKDKNKRRLLFLIIIIFLVVIFFSAFKIYQQKKARKPAVFQLVPGQTQPDYPCSQTICIPTPPESPGRGWFQTKIGDVFGGGRISSRIPQTVPLISRYFINSQPGGLVFSGQGLGINLGDSSFVSPDSNWKIDGYPNFLTGITFTRLKSLARLIFSETEKEFDETKKINDLGNGVWFIQNDLEIKNEDLVIAGNKKLIIFVGTNTEPKDLKILKNIKIQTGDNSVIAFIVSKNILIDPEVSEVNGLFYAAGINELNFNQAGIHTGTKKPAANDIQLKIFGSLIAGPEANLFLERDLGDLLNQTQPGEIVILEPRYFVLLASLFRPPIISWQSN